MLPLLLLTCGGRERRLQDSQLRKNNNMKAEFRAPS
jgi:hypothetical protein